jgi:diguanylate cyclase (GGDEF)-like protein
LDLDNFKIINDSLGHDAGDELLNQVAARLKECVRNHGAAGRFAKRGETVRLGGDEFVVLCESIDDREQAVRLAEQIVKRITEPFRIGDRLVNIGTSVGVAFLNETVRDAHEALRNADTAMYRAKNSGKGRVAVFDHTMRDDLIARLELEDALRAAVEQETFSLNYQPIVDLRSGKVLGAEALLRWSLADGRSIPPAQFLPMIEEIGLSPRVGEWVLERTMREFVKALEQYGHAFHSAFYLGVNISRPHLSDPLFFERLENLILKTGFERHRLKLEINESNDTRGEEQALQTMRELHRSGIGIQIDDFGKGCSPLTCFRDYPIAAVKIDQSFTAAIANDHSHAVIARAIVQLAHHLKAGIIAEGVNSVNQLECLRKWGCDAAQGSLFSPPLDAFSLCELMKDPLCSDGIRMLRSTPAPSIAVEFDHSASTFNPTS